MFDLSINVAGIKNEKNGRPSEDAVASFRHNGALAVVSCDGVSASEYGGKAAQAIAEEIAYYLAIYAGQLLKRGEESIRHEVLQLIRCRQDIMLQRYGMAREELGTTISAAVLTPDNCCLAISLGDGMVIARDHRTQNLSILLGPDGDAETRATWCTAHGDEDILNHLRIRVAADVDAVSVFSDGMESVFYSRTGRIYKDLATLMERLPKEGAEALRAEVQERVYDLAEDDASGVVAVNRPVPKYLLMGRSPERYLQQKNKNARRYIHYLQLRDSGISVRDAARRVGWRKTWVFQRNISFLESVGLESCRLRKFI